MIPYGRQEITEEDIQAVIDVLKSDYLTQGPTIPIFEQAVATYCGVKFGVAVNSATSALHIACMALNLGKGDILWTSPITFVASANCALYCGSTVDFVDIDPLTYNMSVEALEKKLQQAEVDGKLPKIVIPVHLAGQSCEMDKIYLLSKKYGFKIIEDASHAIGGKYKGSPIGNCLYSDVTVFSFHPVKIITSGEGGMCMTNDPEIALRLSHFRSHGITRQPSEMTHVPDGPWYYQQIDLGFNYRITDIQAALGLSQLQRLDEFVHKRHEIARRYDNALASDTLTLHYQNPDTYSAYHLYIIRHKNKEGGLGRLQIFEKLRASGILVNLHYIPVYHHPYYEKSGKYNRADFPNSEAYYAEAISIPMYTMLTNDEQQFVIDQIEKPMGHQNLF